MNDTQKLQEILDYVTRLEESIARFDKGEFGLSTSTRYETKRIVCATIRELVRE